MFAVKIDDCLLHGDSSHLVSVIQYEGLTSTTLSTLDTLVTKDLCGSGFSRVLVVLKSLRILSENKDDLQTLIDNGLSAKVLLWFDAVCDLLTSDLHRGSAPLLSLMEAFCDYFLLLGQASPPASQLSVVLLHLARVAMDTRIHFPLRLEAIRTFNSVLEPLSRDQRRVIQNDQNQILSQVAAAVLTVGDSFSSEAAALELFQWLNDALNDPVQFRPCTLMGIQFVTLGSLMLCWVSLSEALCRLTPRKDREQRASQWFSNRDISRAFCDIRDGDFEVDCRRFLNFINGYHGDQRRVYTFPCLTAFLESTQLFQPKDEKLNDFWIDFNLGSGCVSFFIDEPKAFLWGSVHLPRDEVDHYSLQLKDDGCSRSEVVLSVRLANPIMHHNSSGQTVKLSFSCVHQKELEAATERVFMKAQSFPQVKGSIDPVQTSPSVAKHGDRCYSRKKPQSKSVLKILPLSSPSSEDESSAPKAAGRNRAEVLFDQIVHSTPSYRSGVRVGTALETSDPTDSFGQSGSDLKQDISSSSRKRSAQDSGYLSDPNYSMSTQKAKMEPRSDGEESLAQTGCSAVEEDGFSTKEAGLSVEHPVTEPEAEPPLDLTSGITAAFRRFKNQLEKHFSNCWTKEESEVLLSLNECHQHVSSLLTAVHQHRSLMLLKFENGITDQLEQLDRTSTNLNCINSQILSFFQSEMKQLGSFCDEHLQRLKSLENEDDLAAQ